MRWRAPRIGAPGLLALAALLVLGPGLLCSSPPPPPPTGLEDTETRAVAVYLTLADARENRGDLDGALAAVDKALASQPRSRRALLRRAELLVLLADRDGDPQRLDEARTQLAQALDPDDPESLYVQARLSAAEQRWNDALDALERALEVRPEWPRALRALGLVRWQLGDAAGALEAFERALEIKPSYWPARRERARVRLAHGEIETALPDVREALRMDRDDEVLREELAFAQVQLGRYDDAMRTFAAIPDTERSSDASVLLGKLYGMRGRNAEAREQLEAVQLVEPGRGDVYEGLFLLDVKDGKAEAGLERVEAALQTSPDDVELLQIRGSILSALDRREESAESFRRAFELDPNQVEGYLRVLGSLLGGLEPDVARTQALELGLPPAPTAYAVGLLYESKGERRAAIRSFEQAIAADAKLAPARNSLAFALAESGGDLDRALSLAREARVALPESPYVADTLGWVLHLSDQNIEAEPLLYEALRGSPADSQALPEIHYHLAVTLVALGKYEPALVHARRALDGASSAAGERSWAEAAEALHAKLTEANE
ncbi:MAG: tetratricopeptide repeat protein [Myxococcota bacterium]|nr:tetratricopeptide repeat protein [Myxococcota bacterium]